MMRSESSPHTTPANGLAPEEVISIPEEASASSPREQPPHQGLEPSSLHVLVGPDAAQVAGELSAALNAGTREPGAEHRDLLAEMQRELLPEEERLGLRAVLMLARRMIERDDGELLKPPTFSTGGGALSSEVSGGQRRARPSSEHFLMQTVLVRPRGLCGLCGCGFKNK